VHSCTKEQVKLREDAGHSYPTHSAKDVAI
jgi:hypothetical protein